MLNRDIVFAEIVNQAEAARAQGRFIRVAALAADLNKKGLRRCDGRPYVAGRGSYRAVAAAWAWARRWRGQASADAVAETFLTRDGRRAWDPERVKVA
jgi:hypothetical protein